MVETHAAMRVDAVDARRLQPLLPVVRPLCGVEQREWLEISRGGESASAQQCGASNRKKLLVKQVLGDQLRPISRTEPHRDVDVRTGRVQRAVRSLDLEWNIRKFLFELRESRNEHPVRERRIDADPERAPIRRGLEIVRGRFLNLIE